MKRSTFNILHIIALKPLFFEKNQIKKKTAKTHIYVFWGADSEYDDENTSKFDFQGQNWKQMFLKIFFLIVCP